MSYRLVPIGNSLAIIIEGHRRAIKRFAFSLAIASVLQKLIPIIRSAYG